MEGLAFLWRGITLYAHRGIACKERNKTRNWNNVTDVSRPDHPPFPVFGVLSTICGTVGLFILLKVLAMLVRLSTSWFELLDPIFVRILVCLRKSHTMVGGMLRVLNIPQYSITSTAEDPAGKGIYHPQQNSFNKSRCSTPRCSTPFPVETPLMTTDLRSTFWTNTLRNCILWWRFCFCYFSR